MNPGTPLNDVSHVIQLAVAPVFLLTPIATLINVLRGVSRGRSTGDVRLR